MVALALALAVVDATDALLSAALALTEAECDSSSSGASERVSASGSSRSVVSATSALRAGAPGTCSVGGATCASSAAFSVATHTMDPPSSEASSAGAKASEQAQTKVEGNNFDIRKHVDQYDDVMNRHRDVIYTERRKILKGADLSEDITEMIEQEIARVFDAFAPANDPEHWDIESLIGELKAIMPLPTKCTPRYIRDPRGEEPFEEILQGARHHHGPRGVVVQAPRGKVVG